MAFLRRMAALGHLLSFPRLSVKKNRAGATIARAVKSIVMKGAICIDAYVLDTLMRDLVGHDQRSSAYLVYLGLWRMAGGGRRPRAQASLQQVAEETGLSKRTVQSAIRHLAGRRLLRAEREHRTAIPVYEILRPWRR